MFLNTLCLERELLSRWTALRKNRSFIRGVVNAENYMSPSTIGVECRLSVIENHHRGTSGRLPRTDLLKYEL